MKYFLKRGEKVQGPFSHKQLLGFVRAKKVVGSDLVSNSADGPFQELKSVWDRIKRVAIQTNQAEAPPSQDEKTDQPSVPCEPSTVDESANLASLHGKSAGLSSTLKWILLGVICVVILLILVVEFKFFGGLLLLLLGLGGMAAIPDSWRRQHSFTMWRQVEGEIVDSGWIRRTVRSSEEGTQNIYGVVIIYSYEIDGRTYESSQLRGEDHLDFKTKFFANRFVAKYPVGRKVVVYVNPEEHSDSVLYPNVQYVRTIALPLLMSCMFILMGGALMVSRIQSLINLFTSQGEWSSAG
ncbi:DUF3592 domain-containing protein [Bremerella sp. P1]|uniref:DUF3592 domain-containing protein n=1 Tax=Bremerella sp. P1 TaxID=3026424 RepID=UPI002368D5CE|nr:DUF3592 domain-containing protein [Bremerella sp. P1]WDI39886.1 DUF3592 domain-containing protein [Bremerella sp. P1]